MAKFKKRPNLDVSRYERFFAVAAWQDAKGDKHDWFGKYGAQDEASAALHEKVEELEASGMVVLAACTIGQVYRGEG